MFGFKKKKYLDCPHLKHTLHLFYGEIRACCSNVKGPVFYADYDGRTPVSADYIYKKRKEYIKKINSPFYPDAMPFECRGCYLAEGFMSEKKAEPFENKIKTVFIQNNMSCNAKCTYCTFKNEKRGYTYTAAPVIKALFENNALDKKAQMILSGGEITITPDFEELIDFIIKNLDSQIFISTSGIKYSKSIENAFIMIKCWQTISLDSGTEETYKKIKQTDCFYKVINNLKQYRDSSENAGKCTILKYILLEGVNDNKQEIDTFFNIVKKLRIKNVRIDINYEVYSFNNDNIVPDYQRELINYFNKTAAEFGITAMTNEQTEAILNKKQK